MTNRVLVERRQASWSNEIEDVLEGVHTAFHLMSDLERGRWAFLHVGVSFAVLVRDPSAHVHHGVRLLLKVENASATEQVAVSSKPGLAAVRKENVVIVAGEVVVAVSASTDPAYLARVLRDSKHARIQSLAVDSLFFVASDRVEVREVHEFLNRPVHENEVTVMVIVRELSLLLFKPGSCLDAQTRLSW